MTKPFDIRGPTGGNKWKWFGTELNQYHNNKIYTIKARSERKQNIVFKSKNNWSAIRTTPVRTSTSTSTPTIVGTFTASATAQLLDLSYLIGTTPASTTTTSTASTAYPRLLKNYFKQKHYYVKSNKHHKSSGNMLDSDLRSNNQTRNGSKVSEPNVIYRSLLGIASVINKLDTSFRLTRKIINLNDLSHVSLIYNIDAGFSLSRRINSLNDQSHWNVTIKLDTSLKSSRKPNNLKVSQLNTAYIALPSQMSLITQLETSSRILCKIKNLKTQKSELKCNIQTDISQCYRKAFKNKAHDTNLPKSNQGDSEVYKERYICHLNKSVHTGCPPLGPPKVKSIFKTHKKIFVKSPVCSY